MTSHDPVDMDWTKWEFYRLSKYINCSLFPLLVVFTALWLFPWIYDLNPTALISSMYPFLWCFHFYVCCLNYIKTQNCSPQGCKFLLSFLKETAEFSHIKEGEAYSHVKWKWTTLTWGWLVEKEIGRIINICSETNSEEAAGDNVSFRYAVGDG
jgi:hypothetical protein